MVEKWARLVGQKIVRIGWEDWPHEEAFEVEVEGGQILKIEAVQSSPPGDMLSLWVEVRNA